MATEILMPRQGNSGEACLILEWHTQVGARINAGDVICEVETDKAAFEIESEVSGVVTHILHEAGANVPPLTPIAIIK